MSKLDDIDDDSEIVERGSVQAELRFNGSFHRLIKKLSKNVLVVGLFRENLLFV